MPAFGSLVGVDWLNQNSQRNFPLSDEATVTDVLGGFQLPEDFIVDLIIPVSYAAGRDIGKFHLMEVGVFGNGITLKIGYGGVWGAGEWATEPVEVGRLSISDTHTENSSYFIYGIGDFADSIGKVTIGELDTLFTFSGVYSFDIAGGRIVPSCIRPDIRSVSSLRVVNGNDTSDPLYGDVELVAGPNIQLTVENGKVRIDAIESDNLNTDCGCVTQADITLADPIRSINGILPNADGNITLSGARCINVSNLTNAIELDDECATPCCNSEELEVILTDLNQLSRDVRLHNTTMQLIEVRLQQLETLVDAIEASGFLIENTT